MKTRGWSEERKRSVPKNAGDLLKQDKARNSFPEAPEGTSPVFTLSTIQGPCVRLSSELHSYNKFVLFMPLHLLFFSGSSHRKPLKSWRTQNITLPNFTDIVLRFKKGQSLAPGPLS